MNFFKPQKEQSAQAVGIPVTHFDLTPAYDIFVNLTGEDRVYENVRLIGIRTFDKITEFHTGVLCGLLEIEAANGARMLIPQFGIQLMCLHGTNPIFKVLRRTDSHGTSSSNSDRKND